MARKLLLSAELPIELTNGNDGRGSKWFSSAKVRDKIERDLRTLGMVRSPFDCPVIVRVTRLCGKGQRLWDSSSVGRGNWKEIEDALVVLGWFVDDGPKYITETRFRQVSQTVSGRVKPATVIDIFEAAEAAVMG
jgi:hypothetical protein